MKDAILLVLADKWRRDAEEPEVQDGSAEAEIHNARAAGVRAARRDCAAILANLVGILGDNDA